MFPTCSGACVLVPFWIVLLAAYGLYTRDIKRISHSTVDDIPWMLHAVLVACLLTWVYYNVLTIPKLEFFDVLLLGGIAVVAMLILRSLTRRLAIHVLGAERVLFVGDKPMDFLMNKMTAHPEYGLKPIGVAPASSQNGELEAAIQAYAPDRIVLCEHDVAERDLLALIHRCRELALKVSVLPQLFSALGPSVEVDDVEGVTVLGINPPVLSRSSRCMKRAFDLVASVSALVLCAPLMAVIAVAIKLDSRGPVFFRQQRVGRGGKPFRLLKFRTMVRRTPSSRGTSCSPRARTRTGSSSTTTRGSPGSAGCCATRASTSCPQFWNVVRGEMSLVGPRPLIASEDCQIAGWARTRLELTPGLTGLWQVLGRTSIPFEEMVKLDYLYVTNWSLWADLRLILRTVPAVFTQRGAN